MGPEETAKRLMEEAKAQLADRPALLVTLNLAMGAYGDAIRGEREACCAALCPRCAQGEPLLAPEECRKLNHQPGPCHRYREGNSMHEWCGAAAIRARGAA